MIDAREEVLSSAPPQHRRRAAASASVTTGRGSKASALPTPKQARVERVFSEVQKGLEQLVGISPDAR